MDKKTEALKLAEDALKRVRTQDMELVQLSMIALAAIQEALAEQPAPMIRGDIRDGLVDDEPAQQEPVAWMHEWEDGERIPMLTGRDDRNNDQPKSVRPLVYGDTPPQAQRKPLTDEEIETMANDFEEGYVFLYRSFARAIEAKLWEKNQ